MQIRFGSGISFALQLIHHREELLALLLVGELLQRLPLLRRDLFGCRVHLKVDCRAVIEVSHVALIAVAKVEMRPHNVFDCLPLVQKDYVFAEEELAQLVLKSLLGSRVSQEYQVFDDVFRHCEMLWLVVLKQPMLIKQVYALVKTL